MSLAVIIPVHNDAGLLRKSLAAIAAGSRVPDELIVVDDASTDESCAVAHSFGAFVVHRETNQGPAAARNAGAAVTSCDIIVFLDADTCVEVGTILALENCLRDDPAISAVIGSYDQETPEQGPVSQFRNLAHHFVHGTSARDALTFWSGCGAIRRHVLLRAGGFDESYRRPSIEDIELGYRLSGAGERILLAPDIRVTHLKRWTLLSAIGTDVLDRGAPWFELLLRRSDVPNDLNVTTRHRLSTAAVAIAWVLLLFAPARPQAVLLAAGCLAIAALLHADLWSFLVRKKGVAFLLPAFPLFFLQQSCNIAAVLVGSFRFILFVEKQKPSRARL